MGLSFWSAPARGVPARASRVGCSRRCFALQSSLHSPSLFVSVLEIPPAEAGATRWRRRADPQFAHPHRTAVRRSRSSRRLPDSVVLLIRLHSTLFLQLFTF